MGCPSEDRKFLINHKIRDVNFDKYIKLSIEKKCVLYEKWFPYDITKL